MIQNAILKKLFFKENGKLSKGKLLNNGLGAYFAVSSYNDSRQEGKGVLSSASSAISDFALNTFMPGGFLGYMAVSALPEAGGLAIDAYDQMSAYGRSLQKQRRNTPFQNATFVDSQQTYTMRQAGMNLARQGQMAAQQTTMGNEASSISYMGR